MPKKCRCSNSRGRMDTPRPNLSYISQNEPNLDEKKVYFVKYSPVIRNFDTKI